MRQSRNRPRRTPLYRDVDPYRWAWPLGVALVTFIVFLPALRNGFVPWDDDKNFLNNPHYRGLGLSELGWMWTTFRLGHYVPLSWMTLGWDYTLWEMNPLGYHLTNVLLHTLNAVLVYFISVRLLRKSRLASASAWNISSSSALGALLFAVHPLRVESVAWVTERRDVLSLLFMLASVWCFLGYARPSGLRTRWLWYSLVLFVCGLLSKATVMTLPAILFVLDIYPLGRVGGKAGWWNAGARRVYAELVPFALLSVGAILLSIVALHPPPQFELAQKAAVSAYSLGFYALKTIAPLNLSPLYQMPVRINPAATQFVISYAAVVLMAGGTLAARRKLPALTTCLVIALIAVLPMLGFVQNGPQIAADRYTYFSAPAIGVLVAIGICWARPALSRSLRAASVAAVLVLSVLTWQQEKVWHDGTSLWSHALDVDDNSSIAHGAFASDLLRQGRVAEAVDHSQRAVALATEDPEAHDALGVSLARSGRTAEAVPHFARALAIKPTLDDAENNWGIATIQTGDIEGAMKHYRAAIAINPDNADAYVNIGNALVRLDRDEEAIPYYRDALHIRPNLADAEHNWGVALARDGKFADAADHFRRALDMNPMHEEARGYLEKVTQLLRSAPVAK